MTEVLEARLHAGNSYLVLYFFCAFMPLRCGRPGHPRIISSLPEFEESQGHLLSILLFRLFEECASPGFYPFFSGLRLDYVFAHGGTFSISCRYFSLLAFVAQGMPIGGMSAF